MFIVYPFILLLIGFVLFVLNARYGKTRGLDLGMVFVSILLIYGFVPSVGLLFAHYGVGQIMDSRFSSGVEAADIEDVQWMHLLLVIGFMLGYFSGAKKTATEIAASLSLDSKRLIKPLLALAIAGYLLPALLLLVWGGNVESDYISTYTALRSAPILVQQVYGVLNQLQLSSIVAAVVVLVAANPHRHNRVALILGVNMLFVSFMGGSRTLAFLAFFSYIVASSIFVPSFSARKVLMYVVPGLFLYMLAGMLRDKSEDAGLLYLFQTGEFTVLFLNAIDLKDRLAEGWGEQFRFAFYMVDVLRLIPSQLLDGVKMDPARWYAETFYPDYYDAGGGFAFGILSECAAGFGALEAAVRGLLLGFIFRFSRNRLMGKKVSVAHVFVYVWMISVCYLSYRDTTFSLAVRAIYQLVPILLVIGMFKHRDTRMLVHKVAPTK